MDIAKEEYEKIIREISESDDLVIEEYHVEDEYDESFDITHIELQLPHRGKRFYQVDIKYDDGREKSLMLPALKFLSVRTWDTIRNYLHDSDELGHRWDERMVRCDTEWIRRVVENFKGDKNAYFMVVNAPNTEVHLITGEIGICSLLTGQRSLYEIPRVCYQTSKGNIVLFPDEIMPVDMEMLQQQINEGYIMISDGRYLPPKDTVKMCYSAYGCRVGLMDNWEDIYNNWLKI